MEDFEVDYLEKRSAVLSGIKDLLIEKNRKYGNSALEPSQIFYKGSGANSIRIRLDDKLMRIINSGKPRKNDMSDILGYIILLIISITQSTKASDFADSLDNVLQAIANVYDQDVAHSLTIFSVKKCSDIDQVLRDIDMTLTRIKDGSAPDEYYISLASLFVDYFALKGISDFTDQID